MLLQEQSDLGQQCMSKKLQNISADAKEDDSCCDLALLELSARTRLRGQEKLAQNQIFFS